jgi:hypothetical protein
LNHQCKTSLVELLKELIPSDRLEGVLTAVSGKIDADDSGILFIAGALHSCRRASTFFHPPANLFMISQYTTAGLGRTAGRHRGHLFVTAANLAELMRRQPGIVFRMRRVRWRRSL